MVQKKPGGREDTLIPRQERGGDAEAGAKYAIRGGEAQDRTKSDRHQKRPNLERVSSGLGYFGRTTFKWSRRGQKVGVDFLLIQKSQSQEGPIISANADQWRSAGAFAVHKSREFVQQDLVEYYGNQKGP